jgi:hypothetical protein
MRVLHDTIASLLGRKPDNVTAQLVDLLAPQWRTAIEAGTGRDQFGRQVSLQDVLKGSLVSMVPGYRLGEAILNPDSAPRIYTEATRERQAERTFLRLTPSEISIPRLNAQAPPQTKNASELIAEETAQAKKDLQRLSPSTPFDQKMQRAATIRATYEAQRDATQRQLSRSREWDPKKLPSGEYERVPKLSPLADAHLIYVTVKHFLPGLPASELPPPQLLLEQLGYRPGSYLGKQTLERYRNIIYTTYAGSVEHILSEGKKYKEAQKAGVIP